MLQACCGASWERASPRSYRTVQGFKACAEVGVAHLVQISALGAGTQPDSHFLATKHAADLHLLKLAKRGVCGVGAWFVPLWSSGVVAGAPSCSPHLRPHRGLSGSVIARG